MFEMLCETLLLLITVASVANAGGICISGSSLQSSLNGYYVENGELNNKARYSKEGEKCGSGGGQSIYYKSSLSSYAVTDDQYINTKTYQLYCPDGSINTPDLCPSGQWIAGTGSGPVTEATVKVTNVNSAENCGVSALSQCDTIKITGSGTSSCNTYFSKERDNLFTNGDKFIYYNTNNNLYGSQTFICSATDPEESCESKAYTGTRSTEVSLENYGGTSLTIPIVGGGSYTLDCNPPTPAPAPLIDGGLCVTLPANYIDSHGTVGQYISDGTYNGQPRYKSECGDRYIVYYGGNYGYLIANGRDSGSISTLYSSCKDNIGDLTACSWTNYHSVSDSYSECNCGDASAAVVGPNQFDSMPINFDNNNTESIWTETSIAILTSMIVMISFGSIAICCYCIGFKNGQNAPNKHGYSKAHVIDEEV